MLLSPCGIAAVGEVVELPFSSGAAGSGTSQTIHKILVMCSWNVNIARTQVANLGIFSIRDWF